MVYVGIDISKRTLDFFCNNKIKQYNNTEAGIANLIKALPDDCYVIFESTGVYSKLLYKRLCESNIRCCQANPLDVRRFAQVAKIFAKTDKIDAKILAMYGEKMEPKPTTYKDEIAESLCELTHVRDALIKEKLAFENRLEATHFTPEAKAALKSIVKSLETQLAKVNAAITHYIRSSEAYTKKVKILSSIPGIAHTTAVALLTFCPELGSLSNKQAATLAGLAPKTYQSGTMRGREKISGGRPKLRKALYMPALSAIRCDDFLNAFAERIVAGGKQKKVAITAIMRKLLVYANTLLRKEEYYIAKAVSEDLKITKVFVKRGKQKMAA